MDIAKNILEQFDKLTADNIKPSKIKMSQYNFDMLKYEVESLTTVQVSKDANYFMGVNIEISGCDRDIQVS